MALRTLRIGMNGPDVKAVQQGLNTRDGGVQPKLVEDGVFGTNTDKAVRQYQVKHGLKSDGGGVVGQETRDSLFPLGLATVTISGMQLRMPDFSSLGPKLKPLSLLPGTLRFPGDANAPVQASTTMFTSPGLSPGTLRFPGSLPPGWYDSVYT
jgi:peptidoglycan hydrolase-like protein with peptidoglycan-binding domain